MKVPLITSLVLAGYVSTSLGAALIYEPFAQVAGALDGQAGGTGLNTWSATTGASGVAVSAATLTYGDLQNSGGQAGFPGSPGTDGWVTTTSVLADNNLLDDGGTLWFSYMFLKTSGGGSNEKGGFALGTDRLDGAFNGTNMTNGGNGIGVMTNNSNVGAATWSGGGNGSQGGSHTIGLSASVLIVGKIEWGATGGDDETITIYTPSTSDLGTLGAGVSQTVAGFDQTLLDTISFTERNSGGSQIYDEIRFGASYEDVAPVPEPSLALLSILGILAMFRRGRA